MKYRKKLFFKYYKKLNEIQFRKFFRTIQIPKYNSPNFHNFYLIFNNKRLRINFQNFLFKNKVSAHTHYYPLHLSKFGKKFYKNENLKITEYINNSMIRLPLHNNLTLSDIEKINKLIIKFFL